MRPRRRFRSRLAKVMASYLTVKRALGYKLVTDEKALRYLDSFLSSRFPKATDLSVPILQAWMTGLAPLTRLTRLGMVRQVCLFRRRTAPSAFVPDRMRHPCLWPTRAPRHVPFIFTKEQLRRLLEAALTPSDARGARERSNALFMTLLLAYAAGLRLAEVSRLTVGDIDLDQATLLIRDTKFFKSRVVPVAPEVLQRIRGHIAERFGTASPAPEQRLFQHGGRPYSSHTLGILGSQLMRECGFKPVQGRGGARVHDLRHTFAVHRICQWYEQGEDVQSRLPLLATYMGHKDIVSTQRYMTVTAEILGHAGRRFEQACAPTEGR